MAYQPKSSRKFITGVASAALVASAVAPVAASAAAQSPIVKVYQANNITAYKGQSTKDLKINPTVKGKVKVKYKNGKTAWVAVKWENVSFTKAGSQTVYGTVAGTKIKAKVKVTVKVDSVAYVNNQQNASIDQGSTKEDLLKVLPAKVKVKLASGKTQLNEATYDLSKVDFDKPGDYKVTVHAAHAPAKLDREITVKVKAVDAVVKSISAINAKEVKVTFNKEVDVTTAQTATNYSFTNISGSAIGANPASADVQADGKTVVLTLSNPITTETTFTTTVSGVKVKGTDYDYFPQFSVSQTFKDNVAPTVVDVTSITNGTSSNSLTVDFSEPVFNATFKVDGQVASSVKFADDGYSATITGLSLDASKSHTVDALNLTDFANNVTSLDSKTFNVLKDVASPNISLSANSDNQLVLTFDKAMNPSTVNNTNIKVKDELLSDVAVSGFTAVDSSNKVFTIDLPAGLYTSSNSRSFTVLLNDSVTDYLGNKLPTQFKNVTVSKDTTAPTVTGVSFTKDPSTGNVDKLVVNFSKGLAASTGGLSTAGITVIDPNGADVTTGFLAANSSAVAKGATKVVIPVSTTVSSGKYTVYIPTGFATDLAQTPNSSLATSKVVDFGTAATGEFKIAQSAIGETPSNTTNVITVNYGRAVKGGAQTGSATDLANYTLNGAPLPAGTLITLKPGTYDVATITLPNESVETTDTAAVLRISGVQDLSGKVITPFVGKTHVIDSKSPVLSKAVLNSNGTFTVGFGETLATPAVLGDFVVTVNGKTIDASQIGFAPGVGADAGNYVFDVKVKVSDNGTAADATDDFLYIDADNSGDYDATKDIKVTGAPVVAGVVNLNLASITSVKVATIATGTATGADAAGNTLKLSVSKTVK